MLAFSERLKTILKSFTNIHRPGNKPDIFIFSTARSGSTLLMELIHTQDGFKFCNEPLNVRVSYKRHLMKAEGLEDLYLDPDRKELVFNYFQRIKDNKTPYFNQTPFSRRKNHRLFTDRIVFKVLQAGEDLIEDIRKRFDGKIIYLFRHPIPVTISRKVLFPRVDLFERSEGYQRFFAPRQAQFAWEIIKKGDPFERGVLSWCIENYFPMHSTDQKNWILLSYEELIVNPEDCIRVLCEKLQLPAPQRMMDIINRPSKSTWKSDDKTKRFFESGGSAKNRRWLVEKWKESVSPEQEKRAFEILNVFGIDVYRMGDFLPAEKYFISSSTKKF